MRYCYRGIWISLQISEACHLKKKTVGLCFFFCCCCSCRDQCFWLPVSGDVADSAWVGVSSKRICTLKDKSVSFFSHILLIFFLLIFFFIPWFLYHLLYLWSSKYAEYIHYRETHLKRDVLIKRLVSSDSGVRVLELGGSEECISVLEN